jgi:hypothetical protein
MEKNADLREEHPGAAILLHLPLGRYYDIVWGVVPRVLALVHPSIRGGQEVPEESETRNRGHEGNEASSRP